MEWAQFIGVLLYFGGKVSKNQFSQAIIYLFLRTIQKFNQFSVDLDQDTLINLQRIATQVT